MTARIARLAVACAVLIVGNLAHAAVQRTFVASTGSPANTAFNCSIAKPCRAFSEAIGVTNAGGEVIVLDSAGYGSVTITKAVSVISPPGIYAGISVFSGSDGVTVNAPGATVVLRGLSINGQGGNRGIFFQVGARLRVESCVVSGMASAGIVHNAPISEMFILDTIVRDNAGSGIFVAGDLLSAVLDRVRVEHNGAYGLAFGPTSGSTGARATVIDSVFTHNQLIGIVAASIAGATVTIVVERSVLSYNGEEGIAVLPSTGAAVATLARNTINDNGGSGVLVQANSTGAAYENVLHRNGGGHGIKVDGAAVLQLSGNSGNANLGVDFGCNSASGSINSIGNNSGSTQSVGGCYHIFTGI